MPILGNHLEEMDRTYTPREKRRREEMHLKPVRYGFFKVAKERSVFPVCYECQHEIYGAAVVINGEWKHYNC